jgi:hypothetical protein
MFFAFYVLRSMTWNMEADYYGRKLKALVLYASSILGVDHRTEYGYHNIAVTLNFCRSYKI